MTEVSATMNGVSVRDLRIEQDICRLVTTCEGTIEGSGNVGDPGGSLVVYVDGTKRLTGYITNVTTSTDGTKTVQGTDKMILALDTFIVNEVRIEEELDAGYWIEYWLDYVGLTSSGAVETGRTIPPTLPDEKGWQYITVGDILSECLAYAGGYAIYADADGIIQVVPMATGIQGPSYSEYISYSRTLDNSWYRNRAVVFGASSGSWIDDEWVSGEFTVVAEYPEEEPANARTVAVVSTYIQDQGAAEDLAEDLVDFFNDNLDIRRYLIPDAGVQLGDGVTSVETTVNDAGARQFVSVGERCGFVWGWGFPYGQIMFTILGTLGIGDDVCPWFICDIPQGITLLNTTAAIKTPGTGSSILYELETSADGEAWTYIHGYGLSPGCYKTLNWETFVDNFLPENTLLRLNITQVGSGVAGADLTVAVRLKTGKVL